MDRPAPTVADVFRRYGDTDRDDAGSSLSIAQRRVMTAIERCRTAALGGHVEQCDHCGHTRVWYNSCANRHCPSCQALARAAWIKDREAESLDTQYLVSAMAIFLIILCFAKVGSRFSTTGGSYLYAHATFGPPIGFQVGWLMWLGRIAAFSLLVNLFSGTWGAR